MRQQFFTLKNCTFSWKMKGKTNKTAGKRFLCEFIHFLGEARYKETQSKTNIKKREREKAMDTFNLVPE